MDCLLPIDMIINILLRLPVKSLCKLKCVSKKFLQFITDPNFISTHKDLSLSNPNILLWKIHGLKHDELGFCGLSFDGFCKNVEFSLHIDRGDYLGMLPSKWGLICFMCKSGFYACNPSTQVAVKLPRKRYGMYYEAGMGYIKERDEYVLVHMFTTSVDASHMSCEVMRLRDGMSCSWKMVDANCPYLVHGWGVFTEENMLYWTVSHDFKGPAAAIVSFDLGKQEFGVVSPPEGSFGRVFWSLVELGGRLCLLGHSKDIPIMDIWVMKDIENHIWVKEHSIQLDVYCSMVTFMVKPLDCRNGKILIDGIGESLDYYDTKKKYIKRMYHGIAGTWYAIMLYTESFFSLANI